MIKELSTESQWLEAFPVLNELRTHLTVTTYLEILGQMTCDGYRLFGLFENEQIVAVAGVAIRTAYRAAGCPLRRPVEPWEGGQTSPGLIVRRGMRVGRLPGPAPSERAWVGSASLGRRAGEGAGWPEHSGGPDYYAPASTRLTEGRTEACL